MFNSDVLNQLARLSRRVDRLEELLEAIAVQVGAQVPASEPGGVHVPESVRRLHGQGDTIRAIKELREANPGLGLKEAKDTVDGL